MIFLQFLPNIQKASYPNLILSLRVCFYVFHFRNSNKNNLFPRIKNQDGYKKKADKQ